METGQNSLKYLPISHPFPDNRCSTILAYSRRKLKSLYSESEIQRILEILLQEWQGISWLQYLENKAFRLQTSELIRWYKCMERLSRGEPLAYILGKAYFFNDVFYVNNSVLIPRPETEELTEHVISYVRTRKSPVKIIDIGTGCGCIAISIKKKCPDAEVWGMDISEKALLVARRNASERKADVRWILADVMEWKGEGEKWDILVSNPPYIPRQEMRTIPSSVKDFEPHLALFTTCDALEFYQRIFWLVPLVLQKGGKIFLECHQKYATDVLRISGSCKNLKNKKILRDISGNNRFFEAEVF